MAATMHQMPRGLAANAALRNAETLFETQTVVEIREVEQKTRMDVEDKKKQLRLLVGDSYRELIASADIILQMAGCCDNVVANVGDLQTGFATLAGSIREASQSKAGSGTQQQQRQLLYALGSRIKFLVDTSEMIWGALDTGAYLEAAQRFLQASEVHRLLLGAARAEVQTRFPLLAHLWPNVEKFRGQINERVVTWLRSEYHPRVHETAVALAATAFLQGLSSQQTLGLFLSSRRTCLKARLTAIRTAPDIASLASSLCDFSSQLQESVALAGELLLLRPLGTGTPVLPEVVADEEVRGGQLLFEPLPGRSPTGTLGTEAEAWALLRSTITSGLPPLGQEAVWGAVSAFLTDAAADFTEMAKPLLATCKTAADLAEVESALRNAISSWEYVPNASAVTPGAGPAEAGSILSPSVAAVAAHPAPYFQVDGQDAALPTTWDAICEWVMGRRPPLWDEVFESAFQHRAKEIVAASFKAIQQGLEAPLEACLLSAKTSSAAPAGEYRTQHWPEDGVAADSGSRTGTKGLGVPAEGASVPSGGSPVDHSPAADVATPAEGQDPRGWRALIGSLETAWDQQLRACLEGALLLMLDPVPAKDKKRREVLPLRSMRGVGPSARAAALEPFIAEQCLATASAVAGLLDSRLSSLPQPQTDDAAVVEQALLLGRLCTAFGGPDTFLRVVLGAPEGWRQALSGSPGVPRSDPSRAAAIRFPTGRSATSPQFETLQEQFRRVAMRAARLWATWAAKTLAATLRQRLDADVALTSVTALRTWEDTLITQEDMLGGPAMEMRFSLPAGASPATLELLVGAGAEIQRAGAVAPPSVALPLLEWELGAALLSSLKDALRIGTQLDRTISEKGVLQLLFDVRFLRDALAGGHPGDPGDPAVAERKRAFSAFEASLQERLDPIDWATYEPYLWGNETLFYQRVGILYGALLHIHRMHTEVVNKAAVGGEANILKLAPTAARFAYLPISTPSVTASGIRRLQSVGPTTPRTGGLQKTVSGMGAEFSFGSAGGTGSKAGPADSRAAAESAASSAFEALHSKFTSQGLGAFGSLLGDKAAEVTAMAQQSLGDMSMGLPSSLTSALGSGTSGASGLLSTLRQYTQKDSLK